MPDFTVTSTPVALARVVEIAGRWWLASAPQRSVGGTLRFDEREGTLEVTGALVDERDARDSRTVLGISTTGEPVTIAGAWLSSSRRTDRIREGGDSHVTQTFRFFQLLRGAHFEDGDEQVFQSFSFTTPSLASWIDKSLGRDEQGAGRKRTITIDIPEPVTIPLSDGKFALDWLESGTFGLDVTVRLVPTFLWFPIEPMTLEDALQSVAQPIEFFLTLAIGQPVDLEYVDVSTGDHRDNSYRRARVAPTRHATVGRDVAARYWEHLVPFARVEADLPAVLSRWVELARAHRSAMVQYFAGALSPHAYIEEKFLSTVRALEIWHRAAVGGSVMPAPEFDALLAAVHSAVPATSWTFLQSRLQHANEPSLKKRMDAMVADSGDPLAGLIGTFHRFARRVVNTRNVLTHIGSQGERPFDDHELFYAQKTCAVLFGLTVLRAAGLGDVVADRLRHTSDWRWLAGERNPLVRV